MVVGMMVAASVLLLDQATKALALRLLRPGRTVEVVGGFFGWQLTFNPGGAFGLAAPSWFFLVVTVVVLVVVLRHLPQSRGMPQTVSLGMLLGGALGNATDRVLRSGAPGDPAYLHGHVVDFVAFDLPVIGEFPRFNVADSAIVLGFLLLAVAVAREDVAG